VVNFRKLLFMLVNLPNGKTVDMPIDDYLRMGREGYQYLVAQNFGAPIEYPFFGSVLHYKGTYMEEEDEVEDEVEEENEGDPGFFIED
jgi:hypothetical protein